MNTDRRRPDLDRHVDTPPPGLKPLAIAPQHIPWPALPVWRSLDEQVAIRAALIHNIVVDPATRMPWIDPATGQSQTVAALAPAAFASGVAMGQKEASEQSTSADEDYLQFANTANQHADAAGTAIADTEKVLDELVEFPAGSQRTAREARARHVDDQRLAEDREGHGDSRHRQRSIDRIWIVLAALLLAALDVMLLWRPLLNLGDLTSSGALYKWVLALVFAGAQAFFVDLAVHRYRERHREAFEVRDAIKDHRRRVERAFVYHDLDAIAEPSPPIEDVHAADEELRSAYRLLLITAVIIGMIGVFRVAFLAREASQSITASALFGGVVGFVLGGLVFLLGVVACRGNRLGDRLHEGALVVAGMGDRIKIGRSCVIAERDAALIELTSADAARVHANDIREWVIEEYRQAVLLATSWLRLDKPPVELIEPRQLNIAEAAATQVGKVNKKLEIVDRWLRIAGETPESPTITSGTELALPAGPTALSASTTEVAVFPTRADTGGVVPLGPALPPPPKEPWWLLLVGVAAAVVVAVGAAVIAPTPEGDGLVSVAAAPTSVATTLSSATAAI